MPITNNKVIRLTFTTAGGKTVVLSLADPKDQVSKAQAEDAMDVIIEKNLFVTASGPLVGKRDIRVVNTETDDLYDPPQY